MGPIGAAENKEGGTSTAQGTRTEIERLAGLGRILLVKDALGEPRRQRGLDVLHRQARSIASTNVQVKS